MLTLSVWITFIDHSKYVLLFLGCLVEGPLLMMSSGFLYRLGQFQLIPLYFTLVSGDFTADLGMYALGRYGGRPLVDKFGRFFHITPEILAKIEDRFHRYQNKILFISKITMGFGFAVATLIVAGMIRVPFKKYAILNLYGGFIWTAFLLSIGYFFGDVYTKFVGPYKIVFVIFILAFVFIGMRLLIKYLSKKEI
ncbi:MAG: hypothetical protein JWO40_329 [Candidatus Doudnabacteria bacterium]|nr:hypothetical protein [Candidatus Doudnabacteria bacterium]